MAELDVVKLKEELDKRVQEWMDQGHYSFNDKAREYDPEKLEGFVMSRVDVKFSKEIGFWGKGGYYENPKFMEFWDGFNCNRKFRSNKKTGQRDNLWNVAFFSKSSVKEAEDGKLAPSYLRLLTCVGTNMTFSISSSGMQLFMVHNPSHFPTFLDGPIRDLIVVMEECAKVCGGKATVTVSLPQYFVYEKETVHSWTVGKDAPFQ